MSFVRNCLGPYSSYLLTTNEDFSAVMPHFKFQLLASVNLSVNVPLGWTAIFNTIERGVSKDVSK